jgi:hypothetical protein
MVPVEEDGYAIGVCKSAFFTYFSGLPRMLRQEMISEEFPERKQKDSEFIVKIQ